MTKQQFLEELKDALAGEVPANVMMDAYGYYANYIDEEIRNGKDEKEVLDELGKPMLIARSIIAAQSGERQVDYEYTEDGKTKTVKFQNSRKKEEKKENQTTDKKTQFSLDFSGVLARVVMILFMILLVVIFYFVIKIGFWVIISFGIPILLILGVIYLIMYFSR